MMLKEQANAVDDFADTFVSEPLDISAILQECTGLPADVTNAELTSVTERLLNRPMLANLLNRFAANTNDRDWEARRRCRRAALTPYVGSVLTCVFIRLPGVHYTIEIDPELERVVHWEWQET